MRCEYRRMSKPLCKRFSPSSTKWITIFVCNCCFLYVFVTQFRPEIYTRLESDGGLLKVIQSAIKKKTKPVPDFTVIHLEIFTEGHFTSSHTQKNQTPLHAVNTHLFVSWAHSSFHSSISNTYHLSHNSHMFTDKNPHRVVFVSSFSCSLLHSFYCAMIYQCLCNQFMSHLLWENWFTVGLCWWPSHLSPCSTSL